MVKELTIPEEVWFKRNLRSPLRSILLVMYHKRNRRYKAYFRSYEELASLSGMGKAKASKSVKELIKRNIIKPEKQGLYTLKKGKKLIKLPASLATAVLTYKEKTYLALIWSFKDIQGYGDSAPISLRDLMHLTGEGKWTTYKSLKDLASKGLISKEFNGRILHITPLFPVLT